MSTDEFEFPRSRIEAHPTLASYLASRSLEQLAQLIWHENHRRNVFGSYSGSNGEHAAAIILEASSRGQSVGDSPAGAGEMLEALAAIERLIGENIHDNGTTINRMMVNGEWHTGPVVDASFRILRGLQKIAANALSSLKTGPSRASAQDLSKVTSEQTAAVKWPGLKFCEIAARNVMELARFIKGEDDRAVASDAGLAIRTLLASLNVPTDGSQPGGRSADAAALLDLVREEAFKDNSPFGRSDSLALERIRLALTSSAPKEAS